MKNQNANSEIAFQCHLKDFAAEAPSVIETCSFSLMLTDELGQLMRDDLHRVSSDGYKDTIKTILPAHLIKAPPVVLDGRVYGEFNDNIDVELKTLRFVSYLQLHMKAELKRSTSQTFADMLLVENSPRLHLGGVKQLQPGDDLALLNLILRNQIYTPKSAARAIVECAQAGRHDLVRIMARHGLRHEMADDYNPFPADADNDKTRHLLSSIYREVELDAANAAMPGMPATSRNRL